MNVYNVISIRYKLIFPSVSGSNEFASFLFEIQHSLIYQVVFSRYFFFIINKKYLKIDIYLNHASTLLFQASVTITQKTLY